MTKRDGTLYNDKITDIARRFSSLKLHYKNATTRIYKTKLKVCKFFPTRSTGSL